MSHNFIYKIHAFILLTLALLPVLNAEQKERMPNLIILLADDLGYGELGCQVIKKFQPLISIQSPKTAYALLKDMRVPTVAFEQDRLREN